ncbi:hypothetical protein BOX15_Mlig015201g1 [Macrostomum lignano]|uniref:ETS domain-containing protein n=1 Tax=Macrostomum lignano TaxID=282301 RepID=A0A267E4F9_9PLAT|nr:hypothetical protein BOX15_Mlig015201g1 [Macrostomum lignano]
MELSHSSTPPTVEPMSGPPPPISTGASGISLTSGTRFFSAGGGASMFPQHRPVAAADSEMFHDFPRPAATNSSLLFDSMKSLPPPPPPSQLPSLFQSQLLLQKSMPPPQAAPTLTLPSPMPPPPPPMPPPSQQQQQPSFYRSPFARASPPLCPGQDSELYGPASFQNGGAIMVPPTIESGEPSLQNPKQSKQQEVLMLAELGQLPLPAMESWDPKQRMFWLKCMLTKHLHQPNPAELAERVQKLRMVETCIRAQPNTPLESYINIFGEIFDKRIALKLQYELDAWKQVCDSIPMKMTNASYLAASPEKVGGDHLWEHILRLLMNEDPTVEWLNIQEGLFRFVDSSGAARSWGMTKGNMNMSYEKMSRSIRQYYTDDKNGLIQKATEYPKLHYRFNMFHPEVVSFLKKNFMEVCQRHAFLCTVVNSMF